MLFYTGFQGADSDAGQLSLTEQLFDAALGELSVVARGQPCGDFNVEPTTIPCLSKGISAGLWVDLESSWAFASGMPRAVTCKRSWGASGCNRRDFMVGCPLVAAAVNSCSVQLDRWIVPHHAVRASFLYSRWTCRVSQPVPKTLLWPASWLPAVDKSRGSKSVEVQRVWEVYDERLQFMSREDALRLDEALLLGNVSSAWMVDMVSEGCPGHGPVHLLVASAAEVGFRWDPLSFLAWSRPGLPLLRSTCLNCWWLLHRSLRLQCKCRVRQLCHLRRLFGRISHFST